MVKQIAEEILLYNKNLRGFSEKSTRCETNRKQKKQKEKRKMFWKFLRFFVSLHLEN